MDAVLLDTCVLLKSYLCDTLLSIAEVGAFRPLWSDHVMTNHPKDRHVLAAAVAGRADTLVTENLKDFPPESAAPLGITVTGQDDFLLGLLELRAKASGSNRAA